jgi:hypothetical protein
MSKVSKTPGSKGGAEAVTLGVNLEGCSAAFFTGFGVAAWRWNAAIRSLRPIAVQFATDQPTGRPCGPASYGHAMHHRHGHNVDAYYPIPKSSINIFQTENYHIFKYQ